MHTSSTDDYSTRFKTQTSDTEHSIHIKSIPVSSRKSEDDQLGSYRYRYTSTQHYILPKIQGGSMAKAEQSRYNETNWNSSNKKELNPLIKADMSLRFDEMQKQREIRGQISVLRKGPTKRSRSVVKLSKKNEETYNEIESSPNQQQSEDKGVERKAISSLKTNSSTLREASTSLDLSLIKDKGTAKKKIPDSTLELGSERRISTQMVSGSDIDEDYPFGENSIDDSHGLNLELISLTGLNLKAILQNAKFMKKFGRTNTNSAYIKQDPPESQIPCKDVPHIPDYFKQKDGFLTQLERERRLKEHKVSNILMKDPQTRDYYEQLAIAGFLKQLDIFSGFDGMTLQKLGRRISARHYQDREYLCREGDPATGLWILLEGTVHVEKDGEKKAAYQKKEIIGRQALENRMNRSADLVVNSPKGAIIAFLSTYDFYDLFSRPEAVKKQGPLEIFRFLRTIPFFKAFSDLKVYLLSAGFTYKKYYKNEVLYRKDAKANEFYILLSGKLSREATMSTEVMNNWPISTQKWLWGFRKRIRNFQVITEILPGEMFGFKEMMDWKPREESVLVKGDSEVCSISRKKFSESN